MRNRPTKKPGLPAPPREERPPLPEFLPVPRKSRHDGWAPERLKAFIEAPADGRTVTRAGRGAGGKAIRAAGKSDTRVGKGDTASPESDTAGRKGDAEGLKVTRAG